MTEDSPAKRFPAVLSGTAALLLFVLVFGHTVALRHVLMGVLLIGLAVHWMRGARPEAPLLWPLSAWLAFALVSLAWSAAPVLSARSWLDEAFYPLLLFALFYRIGSDHAFDAFVLGSICSGIIALALLSAGGYSSVAIDASRRGALYYYPGVGQASTYAVMAIPIFMLAALCARGPMRLCAIAGLVLAIVVGAVTLNRMFWPAALVAVIVVGYASRPPWMRRHALGLAAGTAAMVLVALAGIHQARTPVQPAGPQPDQAPIVGQIEDMVTSDPRPGMWRTWYAFGLEDPWLGVGFGQRVPPLYHGARHADDPVFLDRYKRSHAHNLFLNAFLQTGVVGVILLLWLLGALLWRLLRARECQPVAAWTGIALLSVMLLKNTTDDFMRDAVAMYFWSLAGWLLARAERRDDAVAPACKS